jgi:phosphoglycolate phosphatase-like HAD superfamily hydrolase
MSTPHVLFWDIDGTLLSTARAGIFALEEAARELHQIRPDFERTRTAGLTDGGIVASLLENHGLPSDPAAVGEFLRAYERHLPDRLGWRKGHVMPNVREILETLDGRDDVESLLLTGNTPAGAEAKLTHYGLWQHFDGGAFCEQLEEREEVARRALSLAAERIGGAPDLDRTYVIGDTPHDVRCGKAIGARTVAVATGPPDREELEEAGAWAVLDELPPPPEFCRLLGLD